jgi:hypothetical protein
MKLSFIIVALSLLSACTPGFTALRGNYPQTPIINYTEKSKDQVWDNIIDFFAQKGIPIKIIDKSSGLIVSDKAKLSWSYEDKKGKLFQPSAFAAIRKFMYPNVSKPVNPEKVTGEWNIRIKEAGGKTAINVNLYNIEGTYPLGNSNSVRDAGGKTTGVFEQMIYDAVK